jgi:hypothetical protein
MTLTDLLICYAVYRHTPAQGLARYLSKVCKIIRDDTSCDQSKLICRRMIKLVSMRQYEDAIHCLKVGYEEFYIREACKLNEVKL